MRMLVVWLVYGVTLSACSSKHAHTRHFSENRRAIMLISTTRLRLNRTTMCDNSLRRRPLLWRAIVQESRFAPGKFETKPTPNYVDDGMASKYRKSHPVNEPVGVSTCTSN